VRPRKAWEQSTSSF